MTALPKTTIRSVSEFVTKGTTPTSIGRRFTQSGIRFIKVEAIGSDGQYLPAKVAFIDADTHKLLRRSQLREGDILFSIAGALGRSTVVQVSWLPANTNQAFAVIRPSRDSPIDPRYLLWALRSDAIQTRIAEINVRAAQANLSLEQIRAFEIDVPEPRDQQRIARELDDAAKLIAALQRSIVKKETIKQGIMQQLLTGETRLPGFHDPWTTSGIPDLVSRLSTSRKRVPTSAYRTVGHIPIVDQSPHSVVGYTDDRSRILRVGTDGVIVFGDHTCVVKFVNHDFVIGADGVQVLAARGDNVARFLTYVLRLVGVASSGYNRHFGVLMGLELRVPQCQEQEAICSVLSDMDNQIEALRARLAKAKSIKQGMMQELLTGRTRLPVAEEEENP